MRICIQITLQDWDLNILCGITWQAYRFVRSREGQKEKESVLNGDLWFSHSVSLFHSSIELLYCYFLHIFLAICYSFQSASVVWLLICLLLLMMMMILLSLFFVVISVDKNDDTNCHGVYFCACVCLCICVWKLWNWHEIARILFLLLIFWCVLSFRIRSLCHQPFRGL